MSSNVIEKNQQRKDAFKTTLNPIKSCRKRQESAFLIRKNKMQTKLNKRRQIAPTKLSTCDLSQMPAKLRQLQSSAWQDCLHATRYFRQLLAVAEHPPIDEVIASGGLAKFVEFLSYDQYPILQFEAAWTLTNISSGTKTHTNAVVSTGILPTLIRLLKSPCEEVKEQCVWCLGNIAGNSLAHRDLVIAGGAVSFLLAIMLPTAKRSLLQNATWLLTNICRGKPRPSITLSWEISKKFQELLAIQDNAILNDALWGLHYLADGPNERIQKIIDTGVVPELIRLLSHPVISVQTPALRTLGDIVSGNDMQTQIVVDHAIPQLWKILNSPSISLRKETCWVLSNIAAGNIFQIQTLIEQNIFEPLQVMLRTQPYPIQKEIIWTLSNTCKGGSEKQIQHLYKLGFLAPVIQLMTIEDTNLVSLLVEIANSMLGVCGHACREQFEQLDGPHVIEELQQSKDEEVYEAAVRFIEEHLEQEDEEVREDFTDCSAMLF